MGNKSIFDLEQQLDAVMELKTWRKKMFLLVEKIYLTRLNEIDQLNSKIIVKQTIPDNFHHLIEQTIRIQRDEDQHNDDDEDDDLVIIDIVKNEEKIDEQVVVVLPADTHSEGRVSKILNSEPVQQALAVTLAKTLAHMGTLAVTNTTTIAATTMAKTALLTTACGLGTMAFGMGRIALGTTHKVWSLVTSSNAI